MVFFLHFSDTSISSQSLGVPKELRLQLQVLAFASPAIRPPQFTRTMNDIKKKPGHLFQRFDQPNSPEPTLATRTTSKRSRATYSSDSTNPIHQNQPLSRERHQKKAGPPIPAIRPTQLTRTIPCHENDITKKPDLPIPANRPTQLTRTNPCQENDIKKQADLPIPATNPTHRTNPEPELHQQP